MKGYSNNLHKPAIWLNLLNLIKIHNAQKGNASLWGHSLCGRKENDNELDPTIDGPGLQLFHLLECLRLT
ncbi:hypothetical protein D3C71_1765440 [compost metagenome]